MRDNIKVVKVIDEFNAVINYGSNDGAQKGQKFLIYALSDEEIIDPDTNESLGFLEIVRGTGEVINVQERMSTIKSATYKKTPPNIVHKRDPFSIGTTETVEQFEPTQLPFVSIQISDFAKQIG